MFYSLCFTLVALLSLQPVNAASECPLYGPLFPTPRNLSTSTIQTALSDLATFFTALDSSTIGANNSYSLQVFSSGSAAPLFEHYHTAPTLPSFNASGGVSEVGPDTIYRVGSITKIFTIYAFLIEAGQQYFSHPVKEFVPELAALALAPGTAVTNVDWADVTIGELASHLAGIASESYIGDLALVDGVPASVMKGFPTLSPSDIPNCGYSPQCTRQQFFANFAKYHPAVAVADTPIYSNVAYQILSYAMEKITGKTFAKSMDDSLVTPLRLSRTSFSTPNASLGVIPGTVSASEWAFNMGEEGPAGVAYTSASDLSALGRSILQSSLLSPLATRRWFKPATLTSDVRETIGYPWGIRRITLNDSRPYEIITSYNKGGTIGNYASALNLIPELDVGFSIMIAGDKSLPSFYLSTVIGQVLLPALQTTAREEARTIYAGTYKTTSANNITIVVDPLKPGIQVSGWYNNGKDMLAVTNKLFLGFVSPAFEARMYPTGLEAVDASGNRVVTFKAVWDDLTFHAPDSMFGAECGSWIGPSGIAYGSQQLDEFEFTISSAGKVISVLNSATRVTLNKV